MNIVGIITEHNPFHNGHLYHVEQARKLCGAEYVVSVMSGHFLQRGEPALFNKWARAEMAVLGGVDLVVELPTAYSVRSASAFAWGSVAILDAMGIVTHLCFGSEAGSVDQLWPAARLLSDEPAEFKAVLGAALDKGVSYPVARALAVKQYLEAHGSEEIPGNLFASPNNILGIEYLKALITLGSDIQPIAIKRHSAGYHDAGIVDTNPIASATSIRDELLSSGRLNEKIRMVVPATTFCVMEHEVFAGRGPVFIKDCARILFYLLRNSTEEQLAAILDVNEGLENRIIEASRLSSTVRDLADWVKTKRYTWTRIQRIMAHILLGYKQDMAAIFDQTGPLYIRVLGLSAKGRTLIKTIKKEAVVPVITRTAPYLNQAGDTSDMLQFDVKATDIYTLLYPSAAPALPGLDTKIMPFVGD